METNENIIDLGNWTYPKSWSELTLKVFQELEKYYSDTDKEFNIRDVLHIVCSKTIDEVNALPLPIAEKIIQSLKWMEEPPKYEAPTNELTVNGEKYVINTQDKLKTGEFVATEMVRKEDQYNYAAILGILCRKQGEAYDSKFENEVLPKRIEMFENIPMLEAMRTVSFFLSLYLVSETNSQLYTKVEEAINLIQKRIETSRKSGRISVLSTLLLKRKLKKLKKSIELT